MMRKYQLIWIVFAAMAIFASCDSNRYFEHNQEIPSETWSFEDAKEFSFEIQDTLSLFNFYVNLRNTNDYPYANLYIFINSEFPGGEIARDTIELQLAELNGKWLGSGYGRYKYNQFILRKGMRFAKTGIYKFSIEQGMREDSLLGISDLGIRLEYEK